MSKRILVVDDSPTSRSLLSAALRIGGYEVLVCGESTKATQMARDNKPDLILLDMIMPDLSGLQVLEQLKEGDSTKAIPVVFLTAQQDSEEISKSRQLGAAGFMAKYNSNPKIILQKIKDLIGEA